ncbi:DNA polymerase III subunit epsilon [Kushneria phosphatilytica]|uniref:DNA polymerase III subunit epsilon n=1 Tax=Kushneria phosphatilytica TaxID=657387 RepID=A0A1S1NVA2_9GAMM|nr:DNA polymerase III subunit epsilon [Kushneria phosphatilytica]OHV11891.1 DNA polymerase III subunit epsilon [Kushneria phosphatilytica]QEL11064.1 DNA polymerase III subunit epsilon [Kushneria phosphatilytica]
MRQIVLDTETTGIEVQEGHRLIEIGGVELVNRRLTGRHYHQYINPERAIDAEAIDVHGITNERVANEPVFADIADEFWEFIAGAELIIHNAPFDVGFIDHELAQLNTTRGQPVLGPVAEYCSVLDTLKLARERHPGQRNSLDALCKRYDVDNGRRELHGALLDAEILADVYLAMTGGQTSLVLGSRNSREQTSATDVSGIHRLAPDRPALRVVQPGADEWQAHQQALEHLREGGQCLWDQLGN